MVDLYNGQIDLENKIIRTVGNPDDRFQEDALRIMRAVRFSAELGFTIDLETMKSLEKNKDLLAKIAKERIRDEFVKILLSDNPMIGLVFCQKLGILKYISPELETTVGVSQNQAHKFDVWEHLLRSLQHSADKKMSLELRISALFHDIGKPKTRRVLQMANAMHSAGEPTFYGHEVVGAKMTQKILENLKFSREIIDKVVKLVRWHMFFSDPDQISLSAARRMVANVGKENIWDLMKLRECDRIGTGRPSENPYRLRKYKSMLEEVMRDPVSVKQLKIDGIGIMKVLDEKPGPKIGLILNALMEEVLEKPELNDEKYLANRATELSKMDIADLKKIADSGKSKLAEAEEKAVQEIRQKHKVK
jgi:putative nucleotidyltransferase with HDIG domain